MSELISTKLQNINQLFIEGLYFKALGKLNEFEQKPDHTPENQIYFNIIKSNVFYELGRYSDALKHADQACNISEKIRNKSLILDSYISKTWALLRYRDFDTVLDYVA